MLLGPRKKPKRNLEKFLGDKKGIFTKKKLIKFGLAMGTAIIGLNFMAGSAMAGSWHANMHNSSDAVRAQWEPVPATNCDKLVAVHSNVNRHSNYGSYSSTR